MQTSKVSRLTHLVKALRVYIQTGHHGQRNAEKVRQEDEGLLKVLVDEDQLVLRVHHLQGRRRIQNGPPAKVEILLVEPVRTLEPVLSQFSIGFGPGL